MCDKSDEEKITTLLEYEANKERKKQPDPKELDFIKGWFGYDNSR